MSSITIEDLKKQNQYFYTKHCVKDENIGIDVEILTTRMAKLDEHKGMRKGDFLKLKDGSIHRVAHYWGGRVQPSSSEGSFYLSNDHCSYSGALDSAILVEQFRQLDETRLGLVWIFHRDSWGAGRRVIAHLPFRVFEETANQRLICSCCGAYAGYFDQHPNQDTGYGICASCIVRLKVRHAMPADEIERVYGVADINYEAPPEFTIKPVESKWFCDDLTADYKANLDQWREITKADYWYYLEVVPPLDMRAEAFLVGEPYTHTSYDVIHSSCVKIGERYFARKIGRNQFTDAVAALIAKVTSDESIPVHLQHHCENCNSNVECNDPDCTAGINIISCENCGGPRITA